MGGGVASTLWSPLEQSENSFAAEIQPILRDEFVAKELYSGIPVHSGKKGYSPTSPVWIEPLPEVIEESLKESGSILNDLIMSVPSGVKIDGKGNITIYFALSETKYSLTASEVLQHIGYQPQSGKPLGNLAVQTSLLASTPAVTTATANTTAVTTSAVAGSKSSAISTINSNIITGSDRASQLLPRPLPPTITAPTLRSLTVQWEHALPKSAGISQNVEVQFAAVSRLPLFSAAGAAARRRRHAAAAASRSDSDNEEEEEEALHCEFADNEEVPSLHCGRYKWNALVNKSFSQQEFLKYTWTGLQPGERYRLRMRYRTNAGWSELSDASAVFRTLPDRPTAPLPPQCNAITSSAVELHWDNPRRDNGFMVYEYVLLMRTGSTAATAAVDSFSEAYRGPNRSFLALGLYPDVIYSFKLAAVNGIGQSDYSSMVTITTPRKPQSRRSLHNIPLTVVTNPSQQEQQLQQQQQRQLQGDVEAVSLDALAAITGLNREQIDAANNCVDAWKEYWDPKTEQMFFFNIILGTRQLEEPIVLTEEKAREAEFLLTMVGDRSHNSSSHSSRSSNGRSNANSSGSSTATAATAVAGGSSSRVSVDRVAVSDDAAARHAMEKISAEQQQQEQQRNFRTKRYQLLHALRKHASTAATSAATTAAVAAWQTSTVDDGHLVYYENCDSAATTVIAFDDSSVSTNESLSAAMMEQLSGVSRSQRYSATTTAATTTTTTAHRSRASTAAAGGYVDIKHDQIVMKLYRETLLADCYRAFRKLSTELLQKCRLKVNFLNEEGIDSGGIGKETFLLLSRQAAAYVGPHCKQWMKVVLGQLQDSTAATADKNDENDAVTAAAATSGSSSGSSSSAGLQRQTLTDNCVKEMELVEGFFFRSITKSSNSSSGEKKDDLLSTNTSSAPVNTFKPAAIAATVAATEDINSISSRDSAQKKQQHARQLELLQQCSLSIADLDNKLRVSPADFFRFLGRLFAKAIYDRQLLDFPLSNLLLQHLLGQLQNSSSNTNSGNNSSSNNSGLKKKGANGTTNVHSQQQKDQQQQQQQQLSVVRSMLRGIEYSEKELYTSLSWILTHDITDVIFETFSVTNDDSGEQIPLCSHGEETDVVEANKLEYIRLMILWKTTYSVADNLFPFLESFHELIPLSVLQNTQLSVEELGLVLTGKQEVDVEEIRAYCIYQGNDVYFNESHDCVEWLWRAVREFDDSERRALLKFFTGSSRLPLDGYDPPLNVTQGSDADMPLNSLPRAHTCFNQLVLPRYASYGALLNKLRFAIHNTEGFQLA